MEKLVTYIKNELSRYYPETEISAFVRIIMPHITGFSYTALLLSKDVSLTKVQIEETEKITNRLKEYEPIQYILGETEFFGMSFYVNKDTLIPRPETEELVELVVNDTTSPSVTLLDIGTGSGCIAISLAKYLKDAIISAWDFSEGALSMAQRNAELNSVFVDFQQVDVLSDYPTDRQFDIIVSNPPYVLESEKKDIEKNVLDHEPHIALFVPDEKALMFYERIADIAKVILKPKGRLYFEINQAKGIEAILMLGNKGFTNIELVKDLSKLDRMIKCELE